MINIRKILFAVIMTTTITLPSFSVEEIKLDVPEESLIDKIRTERLKSKITDIHRYIDESDTVDILRPSGHTFESGPIKNMRLGLYVRLDNEMTARRDKDFSSIFNFGSVELQSDTLFRDNKTKLSVSYNIARKLDYDNDFTEKFSSLYIDHAFNKNQTVRIGQARTPSGIEGSLSSSLIPFSKRAQISRNFGNARSVGIRNLGSYKYLDYDIGLYDSSRYMNRLFNGAEFNGRVTFKPLAFADDKYGVLKVGAGVDVGKAENSYTVFNAHASYNYKKFGLDFEFANANGSGGQYIERTEALGFFTTASYFVTDKLQLLARYDFYKNKESEKITQEYTAGINYYTHPKCRLMLNYVYAMNDKSSVPSHKLYLGLRYLTSSLVGD